MYVLIIKLLTTFLYPETPTIHISHSTLTQNGNGSLPFTRIPQEVIRVVITTAATLLYSRTSNIADHWAKAFEGASFYVEDTDLARLTLIALQDEGTIPLSASISFLPDVPDSWGGVTVKTVHALKAAYALEPKSQWYYLVDDDSYVSWWLVENFLAQFPDPHHTPYYLGLPIYAETASGKQCRRPMDTFYSWVTNVCPDRDSYIAYGSGGPGYFISLALMDKLVMSQLFLNPESLPLVSYEDFQVGKAIYSLGYRNYYEDRLDLITDLLVDGPGNVVELAATLKHVPMVIHNIKDLTEDAFRFIDDVIIEDLCKIVSEQDRCANRPVGYSLYSVTIT